MRLISRFGLALFSFASGCAHTPPVISDGLALKRVVVYRNGVGYFERAGHVAESEVRFRVRGNEIGDFLASFAVIEQDGSSVKSASFPLKVDEPPTGDGKPPEANKRETVVMELDGKEHDLQVGYIAATPVWRPSYRLVIEKSDVDLQAWGVVQNLSGEDWRDVSLSLIAGAPLAFDAALGTPAIPVRPTVTDSGEVIAAVPHGETSLSESESPPPPATKSASTPSDELESLLDGGGYEGGASGSGSAAGPRASDARPSKKSAWNGAAPPKPASPAHHYAPPRSAAPTPVMQNPSRPRNLSALAAVAVQAGATRYDLPSKVTIPDRSATIVLLLARRVPGEAIFLFAPDGGVPDSASHPFRVARFTNKSGGLLERGPLAIFEEGSFLGQGMLDPLPDNATATVPFALERGLAVDNERRYSSEGARLIRIEGSALTIERDGVIRTTWRVRNGGDKPAHVLIKHARQNGARLVGAPKETEDNLGTGSALIPLDAPAHGNAELVVDERQPIARNVDWLDAVADEAVNAWLVDPASPKEVAAPLRAAWESRTALQHALAEQAKLTDEQGQLQVATEETRENLKSIEKNKAAADLRQKLTTRLTRDATRLEEIVKRLIEVEMQVSEQRVRFADLIRSIKYTPAPKH